MCCYDVAIYMLVVVRDVLYVCGVCVGDDGEGDGGVMMMLL